VGAVARVGPGRGTTTGPGTGTDVGVAGCILLNKVSATPGLAEMGEVLAGTGVTICDWRKLLVWTATKTRKARRISLDI
jgi:hypothetical protein